MQNRDLAADYVRRAEVRLRAINVLLEAASWADVVRESQEVVELALKGVLRSRGVEAPRIHDVSDVLFAERGRLPKSVQGEVERLASISRDLRRDRALASILRGTDTVVCENSTDPSTQPSRSSSGPLPVLYGTGHRRPQLVVPGLQAAESFASDITAAEVPLRADPGTPETVRLHAVFHAPPIA